MEYMQAQGYFTLIGIDPGSDTLGLAILTVDIRSLNILSIEAMTFTGRKMFDSEGWMASVIGERNARINAHKENLVKVFKSVDPLNIVAESPFFSFKRPSAFAALTEVVSMIRQAVMEYDCWKSLHLIDPPTVKKAVGCAGNADKLAVRANVLERYSKYYLHGTQAMGALDEHSIDAIAVAICRYSEFKHMEVIK